MSAIKIYLAGPMRSYPAYNHPTFDKAAAYLRAAGFEVFSPAEEDRKRFPDRDWPNMTGDPIIDNIGLGDMRTIIKADLIWICENADAIVFLPDAEKSKGARCERALGEFLNLELRHIDPDTGALTDAH